MADELALAGIDFSQGIREVRKGEVVKPQLRNFLFEAKFPDHFSVNFTKGDSNRPPDGWFWPSTHPTWPEKMLHLYLTNPQALPYEPKEYMNVLSLTMGTAVHGFIETCLEIIGLRPKALNTCQMCPPREDGSTCSEAGFADHETKSRGHMDGILDLTGLTAYSKGLDETSGFELKTMSNARRLGRLEDDGLDFYRDNLPIYYAQNQEYMRLSGLTSLVLLVMQMGYPWRMVELHVPFDPVYAEAQRAKYMRVRDAVASQSAVDCCYASGCALKPLCQAERGQSKPAVRRGQRVLLGKDGTSGFHR